MSLWRVTVHTNKVGSACSQEFEVDDEDLQGKSTDDITDFVMEHYARDLLGNLMEWYVEQVVGQEGGSNDERSISTTVPRSV